MARSCPRYRGRSADVACPPGRFPGAALRLGVGDLAAACLPRPAGRRLRPGPQRPPVPPRSQRGPGRPVGPGRVRSGSAAHRRAGHRLSAWPARQVGLTARGADRMRWSRQPQAERRGCNADGGYGHTPGDNLGQWEPATDDTELIAASLAKPARFAELFDRHFPAIHRFLRRRVGPELADDLAAETFTQAFARRRCGRPGRRVRRGTARRGRARRPPRRPARSVAVACLGRSGHRRDRAGAQPAGRDRAFAPAPGAAAAASRAGLDTRAGTAVDAPDTPWEFAT